MEALLLVDIQNDFLPGGPLAVSQGHEVVPVANRLMGHFDFVIATQDWHPANHGSFAARHPSKNPGDLIELGGLSQILWPVHCIQGSRGAEFAPDLNRARFDAVFPKGMNPEIDSYSGFFDNGHLQATGLGDYLMERDIDRIFIAGLATDYCVKFTALDARTLGLETWLVKDGCRAVNLERDDEAGAIDAMSRAGVRITDSTPLLSR